MPLMSFFAVSWVKGQNKSDIDTSNSKLKEVVLSSNRLEIPKAKIPKPFRLLQPIKSDKVELPI